jgi:hypothetical protein
MGAGLALLLMTGGAMAAPSANLWPAWQVHDDANTQPIDHHVWQAVLDQYLVVEKPGVTRFDYAAAKAKGGAAKVAAYVDAMAKIDIDQYARDVQLAYWINLYNALTVKVVLDHYPVASIRDIDISGWFSDGPWGAKLITIEGRNLSLNDIEHRILRPIWHDPRIHYAVNCASVGCPALAKAAYQGQAINRQLDDQAKAFINSPRAIAPDADGKGLILSSLYDWYGDDFGKDDRAKLAHFRKYATGKTLDLLAGLTDDIPVGDYRYDWSLNDAK